MSLYEKMQRERREGRVEGRNEEREAIISAIMENKECSREEALALITRPS